eukprot:447395-Ditylum_brightwellii.AAC.2
MSFETLTKPTYLEPQEPDIPSEFIVGTDDRLKSKDSWSITNLGKDIIALARMIRDVAHVHDDTTPGIMAIVANNMTLYTPFMSKAKMPVAFCCTFQANVDTINAH